MERSIKMNLDQLIDALKKIKKANPQAGKKIVFAGETNLIIVEHVTEESRHGSIILSENKI